MFVTSKKEKMFGKLSKLKYFPSIYSISLLIWSGLMIHFKNEWLIFGTCLYDMFVFLMLAYRYPVYSFIRASVHSTSLFLIVFAIIDYVSEECDGKFRAYKI